MTTYKTTRKLASERAADARTEAHRRGLPQRIVDRAACYAAEHGDTDRAIADAIARDVPYYTSSGPSELNESGGETRAQA